MNDVIQPRFDRIASTQAQVARSRREVVSGLDRISSGLEFVGASLALLDQPVSVGDDRFAALDNVRSGLNRLYDSFRLDFALPTSGALSGYDKTRAWRLPEWLTVA